jgi:riboflavin kinase/FMN adenylyltransferase
MQIFYHKDGVASALTRNPRSIVTIGTYDGVHLGHRRIISELTGKAKRESLRSVVITFEPHPQEVVGKFPKPIQTLTTTAEKAELLEELGVDVMIVIEFTKTFSETPPEVFVENFLVGTVGLAEIVIGYDHGFGKDRKGTIETLSRLSALHGFAVDIVNEQRLGSHHISSTEVRRLLESGNVAEAAKLLGTPYGFSGTVVHGSHLGHTIGFPTANVEPTDKRKLIPKVGVYCVSVLIGTREFGGMMNIGYKPTVNNNHVLTNEVNIFDLNEDLYGKNISIKFLTRVRDERKFSSIDELKAQLESDKIFCKTFLTNHHLLITK